MAHFTPWGRGVREFHPFKRPLLLLLVSGPVLVGLGGWDAADYPLPPTETPPLQTPPKKKLRLQGEIAAMSRRGGQEDIAEGQRDASG